MQQDYQYMVDFVLPETLTKDFMGLIPVQRTTVNRLFREGKLVSYALSLENSRMWAIFNANSEMDVLEMVTDLPLTRFMKIEVSMLTFYNSSDVETPAFSLN